MIEGVKRFILLVSLLLILLASCTTLRPSDVTETEEGERSAVVTLVSDIVSAGEECVKAEDFEDILPYSYTVYSSYIPSYGDIMKRYLTSLASLVNEGVSALFPDVVISAGEEASESAYSYMEGESVTATLNVRTGEALSEALGAYLEERASDIEEAFSESREAFGRVKKAYELLSAVSKAVVLPSAEPVSPSDMVSTAVGSYFSLLSAEETRLRSNPLYGDGIFYQGEKEI